MVPVSRRGLSYPLFSVTHLALRRRAQPENFRLSSFDVFEGRRGKPKCVSIRLVNGEIPIRKNPHFRPLLPIEEDFVNHVPRQEYSVNLISLWQMNDNTHIHFPGRHIFRDSRPEFPISIDLINRKRATISRSYVGNCSTRVSVFSPILLIKRSCTMRACPYGFC